ncbi:MAG TPA: amylo-alpha-1,6-glucosidase [Candidatus Saccharimonadales bacterium]|nr:amylo-alpha-1,6-glucosidase [Candidatus Saccharimonadales bacterium]
MAEKDTQPNKISDNAPGLFGFEGKNALDGTPLSELPDFREQVPELQPYLLPFQRVIYVEENLLNADSALSARSHPSSSHALLELMGVTSLKEIGNCGPGNAAQSLPEHENDEQVNLLGALFGRDSLHMGMALYSSFPNLLKTTAVRLAELQGVAANMANEEEPGRIIHWGADPEDPIAKHITEVNFWEWPHYGAVDSTPLFIRGVLKVAKDNPAFLGQTYIGRDNETHTMQDALDAATGWLEKSLQNNPEGLLEFKMLQERGIWNQAWKDTPESYMHADGSYANHRQGIASIEVQALAYDTLIDLATHYKQQNRGADTQVKAAILESRAAQLKQTVLDKFWIEDESGGYFALGTDRDENGQLRPLAVRTSNMGHALHLLEGDSPQLAQRREELIKTLFSDELLDRKGVRTLSDLEARFAPRSYHCGSVWLWDNHVISQELERAGYSGLARDIDQRIWRTVNTLGFFVEFVPGDNATTPEAMTIRRVIDVYDGERNHFSNSYRIEKPAQETQAWTVEAIRAIKKKNQPLHPELSALSAAADPNKRAFEQRILSQAQSGPSGLPNR